MGRKVLTKMSCTYSWNCPSGSFPYTVRQGDTLYNIARQYKTTPERLSEVNEGLNPLNLEVGSTLCIPLPLQEYPNCQTTNYYVAQNDDTLFKIAQMFGVSEQQILYSNMGIDPQNIYEGMVLCIPLTKPLLCINIREGELELEFSSGRLESFPAKVGSLKIPSFIVQKQLDNSEGGKKRLVFNDGGISIANPAAQNSPDDIILSDNNMDYVFNRVTVGTEVHF